MRSIRKRLTYANVMSSIAVFVVLGGAAFAAAELPKKSVGTPQLKSNAVTAAKIKKNAITSAKIKNGTVSGSDINIPSTPFGRVVAKLRGGAFPLSETELQNYPLSPSTYTQGAEEDDSYLGAMDVTFQSTCEGERSAIAFLTLDSPNPTKLESTEAIVGIGVVEDESTGTVTKRVQISPLAVTGFSGTRFEPGTATNHTLNLVVGGECQAGSGITANDAGVDVIGTK